jgi:hypothetical protein
VGSRRTGGRKQHHQRSPVSTRPWPAEVCVGAVANDACDGKVLGLVPPQQRTRGAQEVEAEPLLVVLGLGVLRAKLVMDTPMAVSDENGMHMHTIELMAFDPLRSSL